MFRVFPKNLRELWAGSRGQELIEYSLLLAFVALGVVGIAMGMGVSVNNIWSTGSTAIVSAANAAGASSAASTTSTSGSGQTSPTHDEDR